MRGDVAEANISSIEVGRTSMVVSDYDWDLRVSLKL